MASARKPIARDSPSAMTPRTIGRRKTQWRRITESIGLATYSIVPRGVRTATAQCEGARIITPSRTAWPPMGELIAGPLSAAGGAAGPLEPALEALDPAARVHQLLLAGVEGMALGADLDMQLGLRRTHLELVAARAADSPNDPIRL